MTHNNCTRQIDHKIIVIEENRRKATFSNPSGDLIEVTDVDGCLIVSGPRCDKLVSQPGVGSILLELKGSDLAHACKQLTATAEHADIQHLLHENLGFMVVCKRYPRADTHLLKAKQYYARKYKAGFHVFCDQRAVEIRKIITIKG